MLIFYDHYFIALNIFNCIKSEPLWSGPPVTMPLDYVTTNTWQSLFIELNQYI